MHEHISSELLVMDGQRSGGMHNELIHVEAIMGSLQLPSTAPFSTGLRDRARRLLASVDLLGRKSGLLSNRGGG